MHITNASLRLPRRTFLKGLGACIALPLLECMAPLSRAVGPVGGIPKRLIFVYLPNGMDMENWTPKSAGSAFELPSILQPLAPHRTNFSVLSGLAHNNAKGLGDGPGDHARANACFLTGVHPRKTAGSDIHIGVSVDQVAAQQVGTKTRIPSLELSCDSSGRQAGACDSGYACAYQNNISWRNENTPMPPTADPRLVFDKLFGSQEDPDLAAGRAVREASRKSILDMVCDDARALQKQLGATDRRKMDEYMTALRETEVSIEQETKFRAAMPRPTIPRPDGIPGDFTQHVKIMYDLLAFAMQTDSTRIASYMVLREGSNRSYPFIGVNEGHHELSHHGNNAEKKAKIAKINHFHMEQFADFIGKLKGMRESNGSVLDNSMIVVGSGIADGNAHAHNNLPVLLCGKGASDFQPGQHMKFKTDTPMTNLYLSMLGEIGVKADRIGDSTGVLKNT